MRVEPATLRVVEASGGPRERGRRVGSALAPEIERSLAFYAEYFGRRGIDVEAAATPYLAAAEASLPVLVEQIRGMAEGAGVPFAELFAVNAFEEIDEDPPERCSTFTAVVPGATILAHNEMWLAGDAGNVALVVERTDDGPAIASMSSVCCLPAVGVNSHGAAQGIDSLAASTDRVGVPRVLVSRHSLDARDPADATTRAALPGRAGGYAHVLAFRGGETLTLETTAERSAAVPRPGHANHYLDPELAVEGDEPSAGSTARQARLDELLAERPPEAPEDAMVILSDHAGGPQMLCHHADPADGDEASAVIFSLVAELESGRLWVAPGNPCETAYEEVAFPDVD